MARIPTYQKFGLAGAVGTISCAVAFPTGWPHVIAFAALGAGCAAAIVAGVRINRPRLAWPWILIALSVALSTVGAFGAGVYQHAFHRLPPAISILDAFYLSACLCFVAGALGFVPSWRGRDREVLLDVGIASAAAAILIWATVIEPQLYNPIPFSQRAIVTLYPLFNVAVLAILVRIAFIPGRRPAALWFVVGGFALMFGSALRFAGAGTFNVPGLTTVVWVFGLLGLATGALHPGMRRLTEPGDTATALGWGRAILLGAALLVAPVVLVVKDIHEPHLGTAPIAGASAVIAALVLWRMVRGTHGRHRAESNAVYDAGHDSVTGLPNRDLLLDRLDTALARISRSGSRLVVIFLDLDLFKEVNDVFGHAAGNRLLVSVGERLSEAIRPGDTVARFGGDEFVVLCEDVESHLVTADLAERVREAVREPYTIDGQEISCTASVGIAVTGRPDALPEDLLREANDAVVRAKELGRDRFEFFDESMREAVMGRLNLDAELRLALERHEFRLHYQPLLHLGTGAITGVESLIRWNNPDRGMVAPNDFIPAAEASGIIVDIGWWVIQEALDQAARWRQAGSPLEGIVVGVNISPVQLREHDFVGRVAAMIEASGTPAHQLCFELIESALIDEVASSLGIIQALKALGVQIALDDFGTGYSSLSYLQRFPVDVLKIDLSFVAGLGKDAQNDAIVAAIVAMALKLGLDTVAEGVETIEQQDVLRELGCTIAQGFLIARPTPAEHLEAVCAEFDVTPDTRDAELDERAALSRS